MTKVDKKAKAPKESSWMSVGFFLPSAAEDGAGHEWHALLPIGLNIQ
jgi:hypothetical protein